MLKRDSGPFTHDLRPVHTAHKTGFKPVSCTFFAFTLGKTLTGFELVSAETSFELVSGECRSVGAFTRSKLVLLNDAWVKLPYHMS